MKNYNDRPMLSRLCRSIILLGHGYELAVESVLIKVVMKELKLYTVASTWVLKYYEMGKTFNVDSTKTVLR